MKKLLYSTLLSITSFCFGQIGVGTSTPSPSTMVDLVSSTKGFSGPHIALTSTTDKVTILNPADGLMVYNTATAGDITPGYYVWIKTKWVISVGAGSITVTQDGLLPNTLSYNPSNSGSSAPTSFTDAGVTYTRNGACQTFNTGTRNNGHVYCAYTANSDITWQQAYSAAKSRLGYLVTFTTWEEWVFNRGRFITGGQNISNAIWLGYNKIAFAGAMDNASNFEFSWITGEKSTVNWSTTLNTIGAWWPGEPNNNGNEGCVHVIGNDNDPYDTQNQTGRRWNDISCTTNSGWGGPFRSLIIEFDK